MQPREKVMLLSGRILFSTVCVLLLTVSFAFGYDSYHPSGTSGCFQCHGDFNHGMHVGSNDMTNNCFLCHTDIGDNPSTWTSLQGVSCIGCHMGPGLRQHHASAGAPPDNQDMFCVDCHPGDPPPPSESTLPPYYTRTDVNVNDPCLVDSFSGGEDWDNDGQGLDNDGNLLYEGNDPGCTATPVDETGESTPFAWRLYPNNPNPFNPLTTIRFELPRDESVRLTVYTVDGERVVTLVNDRLPAGAHEIAWNGRDQEGRPVPSGNYIYQLEAGGYQQTHRMTLVK